MIPTLHRHRFLPRLYHFILKLSQKHGLFTLARLHHKIWPGDQQVSIPGGAELQMPGDTHYFGFLSGVHERHITDLVQSLVVPGDVCLDVGANIGYFSMMMAERAGARGQVLAFEPVPETFDWLQKNAELAKSQGWHLDPHRLAVSDRPCMLQIQRNEHSTLHQVKRPDTEDAPGRDDVRCTSVDEFLKAVDHASIKLLKVDVEGHEVPTLTGSLESLRKNRIKNLVIEVTPGPDAELIDKVLRDLNCRTLCWVNNEWRQVPVGKIEHRTDVWSAF